MPTRVGGSEDLNVLEAPVSDVMKHHADGGTLLDGPSLTAAVDQLPHARRGGVDPDAVRALASQVAAALDALHARVDHLESEVVELVSARDEAVQAADRAHELLAGAGSDDDESAAAMLLLSKARRVYRETIEAANTEAQRLVADAREEAAAARSGVEAAIEEAASRRAAAEAEASRIVEEARASVADVADQLDEFRALASEVHQRAVGSLMAALAALEGYVADHSEPGGEDHTDDLDAVPPSEDVDGVIGDPAAGPPDGGEDSDVGPVADDGEGWLGSWNGDRVEAREDNLEHEEAPSQG